ncbi:hypothetical protein HK102_008508 [Quaeritorhiza haematococci]|nr:hypothetical protein HK102_008508 [Quaeritorhiza haematococci]
MACVVSEAAFEAFLDLVGGTLEYLKVTTIESSKLKAITARQCPKLAHLFLEIKDRLPLQIVRRLLDVIRELGTQLRSVSFKMWFGPEWESPGQDLMEVLEAHCPNIEFFSLQLPPHLHQ